MIYVKGFFVKYFYDGSSQKFEYGIRDFHDYKNSEFMKLLRRNGEIEACLYLMSEKDDTIIGSVTTLHRNKYIANFIKTVLENKNDKEFVDNLTILSKEYPLGFVGQYIALNGELPTLGLDVLNFKDTISDSKEYDYNATAIGECLVNIQKVFGNQDYKIFGYKDLFSVGEDFIESNNLTFCGHFLYREHKFSLNEWYIWF